MSNQRRMTDEEMDDFLVALSNIGLMNKAARAAYLSVTTVKYEMSENEEFKLNVEDTLEGFADDVEHEIMRRGIRGVEKDVYYKGEVVGTETVYSDTLALAVIKALRPDKYKDRKEVTGAGGGAVRIEIATFSEDDVVSRTKLNGVNTNDAIVIEHDDATKQLFAQELEREAIESLL